MGALRGALLMMDSSMSSLLSVSSLGCSVSKKFWSMSGTSLM